jgi:hypothetical protein
MKYLTLVVAFVGLAHVAKAQQPKIQRAEIKTPAAKCEQCKQIIESVAPKYVDGLYKINVIWKRGVTQVVPRPNQY